MAAQELLEGAGQLARRARISGLVALCAVELCFLWVSIKSDVKVQRCYFYYIFIRLKWTISLIYTVLQELLHYKPRAFQWIS